MDAMQIDLSPLPGRAVERHRDAGSVELSSASVVEAVPQQYPLVRT
jgi:hypothetical protein